MSVDRVHIGWRFFFRWVLATAGGWVVGLAVLGLAPGVTQTPLVEGGVIVAGGTMVGFMQWLILRQEISRSGWWVLASGASWVVSFAVSIPYFAFGVWVLEMTRAITWELIGVSMGGALGLLVGAIVGIGQWLALRGQVRRAGTWVLVSSLSWAIAFIIFSSTPETGSGAFFSGALLGGIVVGGATGAVLVLLLRPPSTRFVGLRARLLVTFSLVFAIGLLGAFFWFYNHSMTSALSERIEEMETLLRIAPVGVDASDLRAEGLVDDARYQELLHWLETVRGERPYDLYILVRAGGLGEIAYVVDTLAIEDSASDSRLAEMHPLADNDSLWEGSIPLVIYANDAYSFSTLLSEILWQWPGAPAGDDDWLDKRNARISGLAPIRGELGGVVGVLGIDLREGYVAEVQAGTLKAFFRAFGDMYGTMLLIAFLMAQSITRPIAALTEAARRIGQGEFEQDLSHIREASFFHHEIDELAEAIEESGRAHLSERRLRKQVAALKIQIDEVKRRKQVARIVEDDFFQDLKAKAKEMRAERHGEDESTDGSAM